MKKKKLIFSYIYIIATLVVIFILISKSLDVGHFQSTMSNLNFIWLGACILSVGLFWFSDALLIKQIIPYIAHEKTSLWLCFKYSIIGLYYGALTPLATGGQPIQIMYMSNDGMSVGKSTATICVKSFAYEFSVCLMYLLLIFLKGSYFYQNYTSIFWVSLVGFLVNLLVLVGILLAMRNAGIARRICKSVLSLLHRIRLVKRIEKHNARIDKTIDEFSASSAFIAAHKVKAMFSVLLSCVNMFFLFMMPYLVYRAFGLSQYPWLNMLALSTFMYMAIAFIPTPGTSLAAEGAFRLMFVSLFAKSTMLAVGLWRILTYYLILIVGSAFVVIHQGVYAHRQRKHVRSDERKSQVN